MRRKATLRACWLVLTLVVVKPVSAFQRYGYGSALSSAESAVTHQLHSAEKTLESTRKELIESRKQLSKAEAEFQRQSREYNSIRQTVQKEADFNPELIAARKELADAERDFQIERQRILKQLSASSDFRVKTEEKQAAALQLKSLADGDAPETRANLAKQVSELTTALSLKESASIADDPSARKAQQRQRQAEEEVAKVVRHRNDTIERDARLTSAKTAFNRARGEFDTAKHQFTQVQSATGQAERAYQTLMQEKIVLDHQRAQQSRANRWSYGRGLSRRHYGPGPLGGALRIATPPTVIIH